MIITRLYGGLGNQMFQYAIGRALSRARGVECGLDLGHFRGPHIHQGYELARVFGVDAREPPDHEVRAALGWRGIPAVRRQLRRRRLAWLRGGVILIEPHFHFWPAALRAPADCFLWGYWQSERYFADAVPQIRSDFTFRQPWSDENRKLLERIEACNAVSLHVRRGDYEKQPDAAAIHGVLPAEYYERAMAHVAARCGDVEYFVFSDDIARAAAMLRFGDARHHFVAHNRGADGHADMRLMSHCRHHILANSSFSWWGAWLNPSAEKVVVAPRRWFLAENRNTKDLIPDGWVLL